jgi:hypothetical protein
MTYIQYQGNNIIKYPVYEGDIRSLFPNTSFTIPFVPPEGYAEVVNTPQPEIGVFEKVVELSPIFADGSWIRQWEVQPISEEEMLILTNQEEISVRIERNRRLSSTDWTQLSDVPESIKTSWSSYRQLLRDIPQQNGFPWNVVWPDKPST